MVLIGIVTDVKSENDISELIKNNVLLRENNVLFINDENIDNIKNVHFDTIIINCELLEIEKLEMLIQNAKNIVLNVDDGFHINFTGGSKKNLITYGFNSKASITISSVTEDEALICVQRNISNKNGTIEIQEVKFENSNNYNIYDLIIFFILFILYFPCDSSDCKNVIK